MNIGILLPVVLCLIINLNRNNAVQGKLNIIQFENLYQFGNDTKHTGGQSTSNSQYMTNVLEEIRELKNEIANWNHDCNRCGASADYEYGSRRASKPIIYAVNCGGPALIDSNGIYFMKDPLEGSSPTHKWYHNDKIGRVNPPDYELYRVIRYNSVEFGYSIPIKEEGDYVLVLKFITDQETRTFSVVFNKLHTILKDFNIYSKGSVGTAVDEYFPFSVKNGHLFYKGEQSVIANNKVSVDFVHKAVNAVIAAIYVMKGELKDVPKLPRVYYPNPDTSDSRN